LFQKNRQFDLQAGEIGHYSLLMAEKPIPCGLKSIALELEEGTYWWCSCGRSSSQPWCDGSHKGTGLQPVKLVVEEKKVFYICQCKHTQNGALCDGSHKSLKTEES
jgi:CDGSH-type Zn-finger protein